MNCFSEYQSEQVWNPAHIEVLGFVPSYLSFTTLVLSLSPPLFSPPVSHHQNITAVQGGLGMSFMSGHKGPSSKAQVKRMFIT